MISSLKLLTIINRIFKKILYLHFLSILKIYKWTLD